MLRVTDDINNAHPDVIICYDRYVNGVTTVHPTKTVIVSGRSMVAYNENVWKLKSSIDGVVGMVDVTVECETIRINVVVAHREEMVLLSLSEESFMYRYIPRIRGHHILVYGNFDDKCFSASNDITSTQIGLYRLAVTNDLWYTSLPPNIKLIVS